MVNEDTEISRNKTLIAEEELHGPKYPDIAAVPSDVEGIVQITGDGADPAGYYSYSAEANTWSGPFGGPSNLVDVHSDGALLEANTEQLNFDGFLTAEATDGAEREVSPDLDLTATDERYFAYIDNGFESHRTTDPQTDPQLGPRGWSFVSGGSTAINGGWYYADTPPNSPGRHSFGADFVSATTDDGRELSTSQWAIRRGFAIGAGTGQQDTVSISAWCDPNVNPTEGFNDGADHTGETFVGEDDAQIIIEAFDASHTNISGQMQATDRYSRTAGHQHLADGGGAITGDTWVEFAHMGQLPADTAYVRVTLHAVDQSDNWQPLAAAADDGGNAGVRFDDVHIDNTSGLRPYSGLGHTHDGRYIKNEDGSVTQSNLAYETATQQELSDHASYANIHHQRYDNDEARSAVASGTIPGSIELSESTGHIYIYPGESGGDVPLIRPRTQSFSGPEKDISFHDSTQEWNIQGNPRAGGSPILTEADESALSVNYADQAGNANLLDGTTEGEFAKLAQDETVTGAWDFPTLRVGDSGNNSLWLNTESDKDISYLVPETNGNPDFSHGLEVSHGGGWTIPDPRLVDAGDKDIGFHIYKTYKGHPGIVPRVDGTARFGNQIEYVSGSDEWVFNEDIYLKGNRINTDPPLRMQPDTNPETGPLFAVLSAGGATRLSVGHADGIETANRFMRVGQGSGSNDAQYIFGNGPTQLVGRNGGVAVYDVNNNSKQLI